MRNADYSSDHEKAIAYYRRPRLIHIRAEFLIHERAPPGSTVACICCGSTEATIAERHPGPELLIDRVRGTRKLRGPGVDDEAFVELARTRAEYVFFPIRCTREQYAVFLDERRRVEMVSGGNRAGKTKIAESWLSWRWMLRGGRRRRFWIVSAELQQAFDVAQRLVVGDGESPPIFPAGIVRSYPTNPRAKDPKIVLVDGTLIELRHTNKSTGGNLKGKSVVDMLWDEAVETRSVAVYTVLINRLTGAGGTCLISTTPIAGHFLKRMVVDQAERIEANGVKTGNPLISVHYLRMRDNVWYPAENIEESYAACHDDVTRRRECDGEWIASEGALWSFFDREKHIVHGEHRNLGEMGREDATAAAVKRVFVGDNPLQVGLRPPPRPEYIGGQDFNCNPMTVVLAQIEAIDPEGDRSDPRNWRLWVFDVVVKQNTNTRAFAEHLAGPDLARTCGFETPRYARTPILCDATGAYTNVSRNRMAPPSKATQRATTDAGIMCEAGFDTRPCRFSEKRMPENPRIAARVQLLHRLMREDRIRVHARCKALLKAITEQQDRGDGIPEKESHHASDRLSSSIDALGYLCWGLFAETDKKPAGKGLVRSFAH